jgi:hypothetical protein
MIKLNVTGTYLSYSIIELNQADALFLQNIMESELVNYDKIFFERLDFKKLGFGSLEDLPVVSQINGFLSSFHSLQHPDTFTFFKNKKKAFVCAVDRLEAKYHSGLYKEFCNVKSTINPCDFSFRRRKGCKYFLLKKQQFGTFTLALKDDIDLNQLLFEHKVHHFKFKGFYYNPVQLLEIHLDDSKLGFKLKDKGTDKVSICTL